MKGGPPSYSGAGGIDTSSVFDTSLLPNRIETSEANANEEKGHYKDATQRTNTMRTWKGNQPTPGVAGPSKQRGACSSVWMSLLRMRVVKTAVGCVRGGGRTGYWHVRCWRVQARVARRHRGISHWSGRRML